MSNNSFYCFKSKTLTILSSEQVAIWPNGSYMIFQMYESWARIVDTLFNGDKFHTLMKNFPDSSNLRWNNTYIPD